jgi:hypothetical protein
MIIKNSNICFKESREQTCMKERKKRENTNYFFEYRENIIFKHSVCRNDENKIAE